MELLPLLPHRLLKRVESDLLLYPVNPTTEKLSEVFLIEICFSHVFLSERVAVIGTVIKEQITGFV